MLYTRYMHLITALALTHIFSLFFINYNNYKKLWEITTLYLFASRKAALIYLQIPSWSPLLTKSVKTIFLLWKRQIPLVKYISFHVYSSTILTTQTPVQAWSVNNIINGSIRDVFLKHSAHLTLCLYLQHRHHTVGIDDAVVKVKGTAHLMDGKVVKEIVSLWNKIVPTTWMVFGGTVIPTEFAVILATYVLFFQRFLVTLSQSLLTPLTRAAITKSTSVFLLEFLLVLDSNGCNSLFGIDTIAKSA